MALPDLSVQEANNPYNYSVLRLSQKTEQTQTITLKNSDGVPYSLSNASHVITLVLKECATSSVSLLEKVCLLDTDGAVVINILTDDLGIPGIFHGEFIVTDKLTPTRVLYRVRCFADIEAALSETQTVNPLTISIVRGKLRDRGGDENELLMVEEWSDSEICMAVMSVVGVWNECLPLSTMLSYTQITFPFRENLIPGVLGELLYTAALNLTRNSLQYTAGGTVTDDKARGRVYLQLADTFRKEFRQWATAQKTALDRARCFGGSYNESFQ